MKRRTSIRAIVQNAFRKYGHTHPYINQSAWNYIFMRVFGRAPQTMQDPLWDRLFAKDGYDALSHTRSR